MDNPKQFNTISKDYSSFITTDPVRNYLHYPAVLDNIKKDTSVLDIGCGDGRFLSMLASKPMGTLVGYDHARDLIKIADSVRCLWSDPLKFKSKLRFDYATSIMVLPYAPDVAYLGHFFISAYKHLKKGGKFISVIINPEFEFYKKQVANRIFEKKGKVNNSSKK